MGHFHWVKHISLYCFLLFLGTEAVCQGYTYKKPDPGGTGKVYMGREIAGVMGFAGVAWLERPSRPEEEKTALAIRELPVDTSGTIADIGAGSGYYSFQIAKRVPNGKVYAVEIQEEAVRYLMERARKDGHANVAVVKGTSQSPNLPASSLDMALLVDVYHELLYPFEYIQALKKCLKRGGKLVLMEYKAEDPSVAIKPLHKMSVNQVKKELAAAGFRPVSIGNFLPLQHFLVFEKTDD